MLCWCDGNPCRPLVDEDPARLLFYRRQQRSKEVTVGFLCLDRQRERTFELLYRGGNLARVAVFHDDRERPECLGEDVVAMLLERRVVDREQPRRWISVDQP